MDAPILSECINSLNQFRTLKRHKDKFEVITENRRNISKVLSRKQCSSVSVLGLPGTFFSLLDWSFQLYCSAIAFILVQDPTKSSCVHRSLSPTPQKGYLYGQSLDWCHSEKTENTDQYLANP
ncbi:hypothetical protein CHARACLAT_033220 [Characodon lateralis]|uniref:Uncharacterized protein n=1 Tax=Characodon lateralis TaxID=208331 RepID=A0ABU7DLW3_9TELE|nr:hypothetical protein [Characodon lateralis]